MSEEQKAITLNPVCVSQVWVCDVPGSPYIYRLSWGCVWGYTIDRRLRSEDWENDLFFWDDKDVVEGCHDEDTGFTNKTNYGLGVRRAFSNGDVARQVIREDIRAQFSSISP